VYCNKEKIGSEVYALIPFEKTRYKVMIVGKTTADKSTPDNRRRQEMEFFDEPKPISTNIRFYNDNKDLQNQLGSLNQSQEQNARIEAGIKLPLPDFSGENPLAGLAIGMLELGFAKPSDFTEKKKKRK